MEGGSDNADFLRQFYIRIKDNKSYNKHFFTSDQTRWVSIYECKMEDIKFGISEFGTWVFTTNKRFYCLDKRNALYCVRILEVPYKDIIETIQKRFKKIFDDSINVMDVFPFYEIVEFALNNMKNDYWFNLAMLWYEGFNVEQQSKLIYALSQIECSMQFSQKNRQYARKEIRRLEKQNI